MKKYKHRVNEREFLNYPGHHDGAYVSAYVEDTTERTLDRSTYGGKGYFNPEPRIILEIADCSERINLSFELTSAARRQNAFHKIDTLIESLQAFREGMAEESTLYKRRERVLKALEAEKKAAEAAKRAQKKLPLIEDEDKDDESGPMSAEDFLRYLEAS
jgi:hypothetical protein